MSTLNVLAEIRAAENLLYAFEQESRLGEVYDAVAELIEAANAATIADRAGMLRDIDMIDLHAALTRCGGAS